MIKQSSRREVIAVSHKFAGGGGRTEETCGQGDEVIAVSHKFAGGGWRTEETSGHGDGGVGDPRRTLAAVSHKFAGGGWRTEETCGQGDGGVGDPRRTWLTRTAGRGREETCGHGDGGDLRSRGRRGQRPARTLRSRGRLRVPETRANLP